MLEGVVPAWPAAAWTLEALEALLGARPVRCGVTDAGDPVLLPFARFAAYAREQRDDFPLYVFEHLHRGDPLLAAYTPPAAVPPDLLGVLDPEERPPWRWLLVGPPRSGAALHRDPLHTSAWNASLAGRKRWALLPPDTPPELLAPSDDDPDAREPALWFTRTLPRLREALRARGLPAPLEQVQAPGEVMFVPAGWWHAVLNLDLTLAVTQNLVAPPDREAARAEVERQLPALAARWDAALGGAR